MLFMTQYTPIPISAAKLKNFAEMKHPTTQQPLILLASNHQ